MLAGIEGFFQGKAQEVTQDHNVDMLAEAREAQWSALAFLGENAIKVVAPAKVNLFLGIGDRRPDGRHDVVNVMHALALHDDVFVECHEGIDEAAAAFAGPDKTIAVNIDIADKTSFLGAPGAGGEGAAFDIPVEDNLVFKAIDSLAREIGRSQDETVTVRIDKHIPMQGGLAGGSTDAAAALVAMAHFWNIADSEDVLRKVASSLGADVAFFLEGGCGVFTGIGDVFERRIDAMKLPLVLVKPKGGVPTAECYRRFDSEPVEVSSELLEEAKNASSAEQVPLYNNLGNAAEVILPEIAEVAAWLGEREGVLYRGACGCEDAQSCAQGDGEHEGAGAQGDRKVLLCGSGATVFAIVKTYDDAMRIATLASAKGWWSRATSFSSLRAQKV